MRAGRPLAWLVGCRDGAALAPDRLCPRPAGLCPGRGAQGRMRSRRSRPPANCPLAAGPRGPRAAGSTGGCKTDPIYIKYGYRRWAASRGGGDLMSTTGRSANSSNRAGAVFASIAICAALLGGEIPGVGSAAEPICRAPRLVGLTLEQAVGQMGIAHCDGVNPREPDGRPAEAITSTERIIERQSPEPGAPATAVTVWLRALCRQSADPGPPAGEPFIRRGPTTLVSGLFLDGGPLRRRSSCRSGHRHRGRSKSSIRATRISSPSSG